MISVTISHWKSYFSLLHINHCIRGMYIISKRQLSVLRGWILTMHTDHGLYFVITAFVLFCFRLDNNLSCSTWLSAAYFSRKRDLNEAFVISTGHDSLRVYLNLFQAHNKCEPFAIFHKLTLLFQEALPLVPLVIKSYFYIIFVPVGLATGSWITSQQLFLMDLAQCYYHVA